MTTTTMCTTSTPAMLYIREFSAYKNPRNGRQIANPTNATWCVGIEKNGYLYMKQVSMGDLMTEDDVLIVKADKCIKYTHAAEYAMFKAYAFDIAEDCIISDYREIDIALFDELVEETQDALMDVMEIFGELHVGV